MSIISSIIITKSKAMKKLITLIIAIAPFITFGQLSPDENYVHTTSYRVPTDGSDTVSEANKTEAVIYYDGMGRAKQSIGVRQGGNQENIIKHYQYDKVGRQAISRLPFALNINNQEIVIDPDTEAHDFYKTPKYENTIFNYTETKFDRSPLGRPVEQAAQGDNFSIQSGHTMKIEYLPNVKTDAVLDFDVVFIDNDLSHPKLVYKGVYNEHVLYKLEIKDENWTETAIENQYTTHQFTDKLGRTILSRSYTKSTDDTTGDDIYIPVDTYNIYDDYGNLTYTISPKGTDVIASAIYNDFTQVIPGSDLVTNLDPLNNEAGSFTITQVGEQLTLTIDPFILNNENLLETGMIVPLSEPLPDTFIGTFGIMGSEISGGFGYEFSIESGALVITGAGMVDQNDLNSLAEGFSTTLLEQQVNLDVINDLGYQYKYDVRNRLIERKVPGAGLEHIVYDKLNRPVLTQDANLEAEGKWLFVKYDIFNRPVYTGMFNSNLSRENLQTTMDNQTVYHEEKTTGAFLNDAYIHYTNEVFPMEITSIEILSETYYDTYDFILPSQLVTDSVLEQEITINTKNLTLGSKVRILGTSNWTHSVVYYDEKARPIYTTAENSYLNTQDRVSILYDFVGNVVKTEHNHTMRQNFELSPGIFVPKTDVVDTEDVFTYDHQNRMLTHHQTIKDINGADRKSVV